MNETGDFSNSIDDLLKQIENDTISASTMRQKIEALKIEPPTRTPVVAATVPCPKSADSVELEDDADEDFLIYWTEYFQFSGDSLEELATILPSRDDYCYEDIILRLKAESLREIKDLSICGYEDPSFREVAEQSIVKERQKIAMLDQLLEMEEETSLDEPELNQIILAPNVNGRIMFSDDLSSLIPNDYFDEVYDLLGTIIDGTFKGSKQFNRGTNSPVIGGCCEVKGKKVRILFRRINKNMYGVYAVFLKKVMNDKGYRNLLNSRNFAYLMVEEKIRELVNNSEFMAQNDQELLEVWKTLGHSEAPKTYRKGGNE